MSIGHVARICALIACLFAFSVPAAHAGLTDSIAKFKQTVGSSFTQTAYYVGAQGQTAVATPTLQMNSVRQHLDQSRYAARAMTVQVPRVSINGIFPQTFPQSSPGSAAAPYEITGSPPTGGGASADKPDPFERWGLFVNGDFDVARQSAVDTQLGFKTRTNSVTIGTDYRVSGNNVLGASVAFLNSSSDLSAGAGTQDAKGYGFTFFGSFVPTADAYVDAIVNIGHNNYDGRRQSGTTSFSGDTSGNQWGFALSAGYAFNNGALALTPYGRVEYVDAKVDGFTESGGSGVATISDQRIKATTLSLGAQASYAISTSWGVLIPNGRIEFQHLANSSRSDLTAQSGSTAPVPISVVGQDKNYGTFAVGASGVFGSGVTAFFNYQQLFGKSNVRDQLYTVGLRIDF